MGRRRRLTWILSAVVLAALVVGGLLWWTSRPTDEAAAAPPSTEPVPAERLTELQTALSSPDPTVQAQALDPAIFTSLQTSGQPLLPPGSTVEIDTDSSHIVDRTATVSATVSGPQAGKFTLLLALEDGVWVVFGAVPA